MKQNAKPIPIFYFLLAFEAVFFLILVAGGRMVKGHDAFIHFSLQYYFLNNVVQSGDIPLWMPFMTHGSPSVWWQPVQGGFLQNVLLYTGELLKGFNFLYVYDVSMLLDELVLLLGTWLLARRLFRHAWTALFVGVTVMGSCIWMSQPWLNFHVFYALPLILYFGHRFLDTGRWRYVFLAGNLLAFQFMGNLPYFVTVIALVVFLYFLLWFLCLRVPRLGEGLSNFNGIAWRTTFARKGIVKGVLCLAALALNFFAVFRLLSVGSDQIINYNYQRNMDSSLSLDTFLHYGGNQEWSRWLELVSGVSPMEDYTLYIGILCLPLMILGLLNLGRCHRHLFWLIALLFLISQGTVVAALLYYIWPMMKYYRHLSLLAVFIKLFLCFLAGLGFESLFKSSPVPAGKWPRFVLWLSAAVLLGVTMGLFYFAGHYELALNAISSSARGLIPLGRYEWTPLNGQEPMLKNVLTPALLGSRLFQSAVLCFVSSLFLLWLLRFPGKKYRVPLLMAVLIVQAADMAVYKISELHLRTTVVDKPGAELTKFTGLPYYVRRDQSFNLQDSRTKLLWETVPFPGVLHWTLNSFLFKDQVSHPYRTDYWLKPFDALVRALNKQAIDDLSIRPQGLVPYLSWQFPLVSTAAGKVSGVTDDKIQFFSRAYPADDQWIAQRLADGNYNGGQLLMDGQSTVTHPALTDNWRLPHRYMIGRFSSNSIEILVEPVTAKEGIWLFYSDVWHPFWRAAVNSAPAKVERANLAYKAVFLPPGSHIVKFYFRSPEQSLLYNVFAINALFLIVMIAWRTWREGLF